MKRFYVLCSLLAFGVSARAQVYTFTHDQMVKFTADNPFDRFEDGRPKIPDDLLEKAKGLSAEEVWAVLNAHHYINQYAGDFKILRPEIKLIGRAVTAQFMPMRDDIFKVTDEEAKAKHLGRNAHQRVLDMLTKGDVLVADMFGKIESGTIVGDNLATAIYAATGKGFVVDGGVRDLEGIFPIGMPVYYKGAHPAPIGNVMVTGYNVPIRIDGATVVPGDMVFGDREGVYFVPPQFVKEVMDKADVTHIHDEWTKEKLLTGKYKSSEIYPTPSDPKLKAEYDAYLKEHLKK